MDNEGIFWIIKYDLWNGEVVKEFFYIVDFIFNVLVLVDGFVDNGLVELLVLDNRDILLVLERFFVLGVGNNICFYEI